MSAIVWPFIRSQWPAILIALAVASVWLRLASLGAALEAEREKVADLEISLAETQARADATQAGLDALTLTTARRGAIQAQAMQDIKAVQSTPEAIADVETVSPAIGSALDLLRARAGNGR